MAYSYARYASRLDPDTKKAYDWLKKERKKVIDRRLKGIGDELEGLNKKCQEMFPEADFFGVHQQLLSDQAAKGPGSFPV